MINLSSKLLLYSAASVSRQKDGWNLILPQCHNLMKQNQQNSKNLEKQFSINRTEKTKKQMKK